MSAPLEILAIGAGDGRSRRRWPDEAKARIVAEKLRAGCAFRGIGAVISRDRGRLFHGIAGSHFVVAGRLVDKLMKSGLKARVNGFCGFSAHAFA